MSQLPASVSDETRATGRLVSLDVFRGLTIASMVLVNNPGTWDAIYPPLEHAEWHGWTFTDTIFPFFVFIMGIAIPIALGKRVSAGTITASLYVKIARRGAVLFGLGLFLALFPLYNWVKQEPINLDTMRIMGVLQRLALCYFAASLIFLWVRSRGQIIVTAGLLVLYWWLMMVVGGGDLTPDGQLGGVVDRAILGSAHIYKGTQTFDPEGLLSTLPAIANCLIGVLCGSYLVSKRSDYEKVAGLFFYGFILLGLGYIWSFWFPLNKQLWTSSYVLFMSGLAMCVLASCYLMIDIWKITFWTKPFVIFGVNALALFVGSGLLGRLLNFIPAGSVDGKLVALKSAIYHVFFAPLASPMNASLLFALAFLGLWLFLMWLLYRKGILIKI